MEGFPKPAETPKSAEKIRNGLEDILKNAVQLADGDLEAARAELTRAAGILEHHRSDGQLSDTEVDYFDKELKILEEDLGSTA
jgi:hypothetical protein